MGRFTAQAVESHSVQITPGVPPVAAGPPEGAENAGDVANVLAEGDGPARYVRMQAQRALSDRYGFCHYRPSGCRWPSPISLLQYPGYVCPVP